MIYTLSDKASDKVTAKLAERENKADLIAGINLDKVDNKIFLETENIGEVIALLFNKEDDIWYGIAKIKLSQLYLFEENNKLECDFCSSKIKINFPSYMLPLPRKI